MRLMLARNGRRARRGQETRLVLHKLNRVACFSLRQEPVAVPQSALCFVDYAHLPRNLHAFHQLHARIDIFKNDSWVEYPFCFDPDINLQSRPSCYVCGLHCGLLVRIEVPCEPSLALLPPLVSLLLPQLPAEPLNRCSTSACSGHSRCHL
jgi:hypothetical protein